MKKAVIYARVSSDRQEKEGFSIPAQIQFLTEYAQKNLYNIIEIFTESETAKKAGRTNFNEMVKYLKNNEDCRIILAEKTDRIYRNFRDYLDLDDFKGLEVHLAKEGMIISDKSTSHEKFIHGIKVLMAKNYIDNLSEEIRKGLDEKVRQGYYPQKAPVGYKNFRDENKKAFIIIDKEKAPFIKRLFELYATGLSASQCRKILHSEGLYNNTKPYAKSRLIEILHDPFYIGKFLYKGVIYDGKHEPLISVDLYNKVQKMFNQSKARTHDVQFDYIGLIKCGHCGCQLTAELKKGKYIYYHCTGRRGGACKKDYIRQEEIEKVFVKLMKRIEIPPELNKELKSILNEMNKQKTDYDVSCSESITKQINTLSRRIEGLYSDKLDGNVTEEFWQEKNMQWSLEKNKLTHKLQSLNNASQTFYECSNLLLNWLEEAPQRFLSHNSDMKRKLLNFVCSNFYYKDGKLSVELNSVFDLVVKTDFSNNGGA